MSLYKYTEREASNLLIGQNGFDVIAEHDTNYSNPSSTNHSWIAIQALGKDSSGTTEFLKLKVQSNVGDDISSFIYLIPGEIFYGNFSGVLNHTDSTAVCIAYRG
tara:strand:+ start:311 stop:625 length:315 start_codon:yes stop_codon:yes gene_type:complete